MGVSPTNPKTTGSYTILWTQKYCTCWFQWVALLLHLLLSYPGMVAWITRVGLMKIEKEKISRCIIFYNARVKNIEQKCFIYHQMYNGD